MAARLLAALLLSCLLLCVCAEPRVARCAVDANVKVPLSGVIAASQAEWIPQLSGWTISVPWSKIEAKKGQYNFGPIDDQLTYADNSDGYGLQGVNIEITTGDFVPGWLLTSTDFGLVSAYWTAAYQQAYRDLTAALAARYDGHALVRGVYLSACTASAAVSQASLHAGFTELAAAQCYYSAMLSHVAYWVNTPTILRLPYAVDDTFHRIVQDFRAYFGPRLGVLSITQDLANAPNADLFDMLKHHVGANVVDFTGAPASDAAVDGLFSLASASRATGITLPTRWNAVGAAFIAQWQLDGVRKTLAALPVDCAFAPGRAALSQSAASVPSAAWDMQILLSPDAPLSASKIMGVVAAVTGLPSSRFQLAKAGTWQRMLGMRGFVYDQPFAVPAAIVARYLGKLTAAQWRSAGLEARSLGYEENLNKSSDDGLDGLYIFLIVLASVIYLCVFVLFCYLMAVVIRYCVSGERNATMATISSAGNRVRGWVRFNDQDAGFPATSTPAHSKEGAATPAGDAV